MKTFNQLVEQFDSLTKGQFDSASVVEIIKVCESKASEHYANGFPKAAQSWLEFALKIDKASKEN